MFAISPDNCEWYTPLKIKHAVYNTLIKIDLDPCSNIGYPNIEASHHYTKNENGLTKIWRGIVYMNPPYGSDTKKWVRKMIDSYHQGYVSEAIILLPARTETNYWYDLSAHVSMWCAIHNRIKFSSNSSSKTKNTGSFGSAIVLLSKNPITQKRFLDNFGSLGIIYQEIRSKERQIKLDSEVNAQ
jgi:hypothetical protein